MKHFLSTFVIFIVSVSQAYCQEKNPRFSLKTELGLFKSSYSLGDKASIYLQTGFGYQLPKNFWINLDVATTSTTGTYESKHFSDKTSSYSNFMIIPTISKDFGRKNLLFSPSLGLLYIHERVEHPTLKTPLSPSMLKETDHSLGIYVNIAFKQRLMDHLFVGINAKSYVLTYLDIESFMIGPSLTVNF